MGRRRRRPPPLERASKFQAAHEASYPNPIVRVVMCGSTPPVVPDNGGL